MKYAHTRSATAYGRRGRCIFQVSARRVCCCACAIYTCACAQRHPGCTVTPKPAATAVVEPALQCVRVHCVWVPCWHGGGCRRCGCLDVGLWKCKQNSLQGGQAACASPEVAFTCSCSGAQHTDVTHPPRGADTATRGRSGRRLRKQQARVTPKPGTTAVVEPALQRVRVPRLWVPGPCWHGRVCRSRRGCRGRRDPKAGPISTSPSLLARTKTGTGPEGSRLPVRMRLAANQLPCRTRGTTHILCPSPASSFLGRLVPRAPIVQASNTCTHAHGAAGDSRFAIFKLQGVNCNVFKFGAGRSPANTDAQSPPHCCGGGGAPMQHPAASSTLHTYTGASRSAHGGHALYAAHRAHARSNTRHTTCWPQRAHSCCNCATLTIDASALHHAEPHHSFACDHDAGVTTVPPRTATAGQHAAASGRGGGRNGTHDAERSPTNPQAHHQSPHSLPSPPWDTTAPPARTTAHHQLACTTKCVLCRRQASRRHLPFPAGPPLTWSAP